ncbi:MAG: polysaccharide deacetylase family protein [Flavobacteriales bacterium]|nr:polysaccharide deacetylase family protein [Flavobacteriales bacterium]
MELIRGLFEVVSLDEIVNGEGKGRNKLAITFDDGFMSVFKVARPVLRSMGLPYAVFINGAAVEEGHNWMVDLLAHAQDQQYLASLRAAVGVDDDPSQESAEDVIGAIMEKGVFSETFRCAYRSVRPPPGMFMSYGELEQLVKEGVTIGDHSWDHYVLGGSSSEVTSDQVAKGKSLIKALTGDYSKHFALPFGKKEHFNGDTLRILGECDYCNVYTTNPNLFVGAPDVNGVRLIPRIGLVNDSSQRLLFYLNRALLRQHDL